MSFFSQRLHGLTLQSLSGAAFTGSSPLAPRDPVMFVMFAVSSEMSVTSVVSVYSFPPHVMYCELFEQSAQTPRSDTC